MLLTDIFNEGYFTIVVAVLENCFAYLNKTNLVQCV